MSREERAGGVGGEAIERLSPREREILDLLARGEGVKGIARELHIARRTVKTHIANAKRKAGLSGPLHRLVVWYLGAREPSPSA